LRYAAGKQTDRQTNKHTDMCYGWIISTYHRNNHYTGKFRGRRKDQVDQEQIGEAQSRETCKRCNLPGKKQIAAALDRQECPNVST